MYYANSDQWLYSFSSNGSTSETTLRPNNSMNSPCFAEINKIHVGCLDNRLYSHSPLAHIGNNYYDAKEPISSRGLCYDGNGHLYFGTQFTSKIISINSDNLTARWETIIPGGFNASIYGTPVIDKDNILYVGSENKTLYAIDASNGKILWTFSADGSIRSTVTIDQDGTLYFSTTNGYIYAIS